MPPLSGDNTLHLAGWLLSKRQHTKIVGKDVRKAKPCALLFRMQISAATMENSMKISHKVENRNIVYSSSTTTMYLSKENKNMDFKWYIQPYIRCSFIYNNRDMETTYMSINRGMDKEDVTNISITLS